MTSSPLNAYRPHKRVQSIPVGESRTKQAFKDETDINNILRKHEKGLLVDHLNEHQGNYGDFLDAPDYHTALNRIHEADTAFMTIPAEIRAKFENDPALFLDFVQNPDNLDEMREMGLAKRAIDQPDAIIVQPDTPTPPEPDTPVPDAPPAS